MRRHFPSLILLASLVLGGWIGPVSHLAWMRYGMEMGAAGSVTSGEAVAHHDPGHHAADGVGWQEAADCPDECLFLSLLAAQASALIPETASMGTPLPGMERFNETAPRFTTTHDGAVAARGPPSA